MEEKTRNKVIRQIEIEGVLYDLMPQNMIAVSEGGTGANNPVDARANLGAAPSGYGYGGSAINLGTIADEEGLTNTLEELYSETASVETKLVYWQGYPSSSNNGWFGILARSSSNNGDIIASSAYGDGTIIHKVKRNGTWLPVASVITSNNIATAKSNLGIGKSLWNGTWSSGTITVPNTDDYSVFQITLDGQGTSILAMKTGSYIRGIGGHPTSSAVSIQNFAASFSGNTWTLSKANVFIHTPSGNHGSAETKSVERIKGIV